MKMPRNDEEKIGWERHAERSTKTADDTAEILKLDKAIQRNDLTSALRAASELQELSEDHLDKRTRLTIRQRMSAWAPFGRRPRREHRR